MVAPDDAGAQTTFILDKIATALSAVGAQMEDVVRTRVYLNDADDVLAVSQAHGRIFFRDQASQYIAGDLQADWQL